jgi:hypothetical protein
LNASTKRPAALSATPFSWPSSGFKAERGASAVIFVKNIVDCAIFYPSLTL